MHALYRVAARPEYAEILRKDIEDVVRKEGWSKNSIDKMHKLDSLLKECQRFYSLGSGESDRAVSYSHIRTRAEQFSL